MSKLSEDRYKRKTEFFEYLKETARAVDPFVNQFIQGRYAGNSDLVTRLQSRYRFGSSQLRPAQVRLAYELVGGRNWEEIIPACASMEVRDTAYYCLDDVLDSEGDKSLILLGGVFLTMSYAMLTDLFKKFSSEQVKEITDESARLDSQNANAALIDLNLKKPDKELYLQKVRGYNFWEHALKIGSILGDSENEEIGRVGLIGRHIGMGYIIANDTWDFGKALEDFRAGKYTFPNIVALSETTGQDKQTLERFFGQKDLSLDQIEIIRRIVVQNGVIEKGRELAWEYCKGGLDILASFPDSRPRRMIEFSTTMTQKNKYFSLLERYK